MSNSVKYIFTLIKKLTWKCTMNKAISVWLNVT